MIWKNEKKHFQIMAMLGIVSTEFHLDLISDPSPPLGMSWASFTEIHATHGSRETHTTDVFVTGIRNVAINILECFGWFKFNKVFFGF